MNRSWILLILIVAGTMSLVGCASQNASQREHETLVAMKYTGELLPYTCGYQRPAPQPALPPGYSKDSGWRSSTTPSPRSGVPQRSGAVVQAYHIGQYVDSANPRIVHAGHTVYRVESEARWRLANRSHPGRRLEYDPAAPPLASATPQATPAAQTAQALSDRVALLEQALRDNAGTTNANQQMLVSEINSLKRQLAQIQGRAGVLPNFPARQQQQPQ